MSLSDYAKNRDNFEGPDDGIIGVNADLAFPCCCCIHGMKADTDEPCRTCDHNANAEPWKPNPSVLPPAAPAGREQRVVLPPDSENQSERK